MRQVGLALAAIVMLGGAAAKPAPPSVYDALVGCWKLDGQVRGKPALQLARGRWVLEHKYFLLDLINAPGAKPYGAAILFGQEANGQVVVHWLDTFGAEYSKTLGRGTDTATTTDVLFAYPDGPTRNRITLLPGGHWRMLVTDTPAGKPTDVFSDATATRAACPAADAFPL
jgi:hypothetical protein